MENLNIRHRFANVRIRWVGVFEGVTRAKKSDHASDWMSMSGNTVCERISEGSGTIATVRDGVGSCVCDCSARDILPPLPRLFRRPLVTISDSNRLGRASAAGFFTPSGASCSTSASIRATCAATHTPSCTFASSTVRLSVLVSIDIAIGRAHRPS